jgi:hypothetical protein
MDAVTGRALTAYERGNRVTKGGPGAPSPDGALSCAETHRGLRYVVLRDNGGLILAVYRIRTTGLLRRLTRWPATITDSRPSRT